MRPVLLFAVAFFSFFAKSGAEESDCIVDFCFDSTAALQAAVDEYLDYVTFGAASPIVNCYGDISEWCVASVENFESLFDASRNSRIADTFNGDLSAWDVSKATDMTHMFRGASVFNADISGWDIGQVKSLEGTFTDATSFNIAITDWDTSNVISMRDTFMGATSFDQSLRRWDTSKVYFMNNMFMEASAFRGTGIFKWDVSRVRKMNRMFFKAKKMRANLSGWDTSSVTTMNGMFGKAKKFNADLSGWNVQGVTDMGKMFFKAKSFSQNLCSWGESMVVANNGGINVAAMFDGSACDTQSDPDLSSMSVVGPLCQVCVDPPTGSPITLPSVSPTMLPTLSPTVQPSMLPTISSDIPSHQPSMSPTIPTDPPSMTPSTSPSRLKSIMPSTLPTASTPSHIPSHHPSSSPTASPTGKPTPEPTPAPTPVPTPTPTAEPTLVGAPSGISGGSIRNVHMKLYWEEGYDWQEVYYDLNFCMTHTFREGQNNCWYGLNYGTCRQDQVYISKCRDDDRFFFDIHILDTGSQEAWITPYDEDRCFTRVSRQIFLQPCDMNNQMQRWVPLNGPWSNYRFEIVPRSKLDICVTNDHHPKPGEVVELKDIRRTRHPNSLTSFWNTY